MEPVAVEKSAYEVDNVDVFMDDVVRVRAEALAPCRLLIVWVDTVSARVVASMEERVEKR